MLPVQEMVTLQDISTFTGRQLLEGNSLDFPVPRVRSDSKAATWPRLIHPQPSMEKGGQGLNLYG